MSSNQDAYFVRAGDGKHHPRQSTIHRKLCDNKPVYCFKSNIPHPMVIEIIGMPGKIVLVGAASYTLYRLRPRVMPYLAAALALVVVYQLAGTVGTLLAPA